MPFHQQDHFEIEISDLKIIILAISDDLMVVESPGCFSKTNPKKETMLVII